MSASCSVTIKSNSRVSARLALGALAGLFLCGPLWAQSNPGAPGTDAAMDVERMDPWTPPALSPLLRGERYLMPVSERAILRTGYRLEADSAGLPLDPATCASGILDLGCEPGLAGFGAGPDRGTAGRFDVGARWQPMEGLTVGLDYFQNKGDAGREALLLPRMLDFLAPGWYSALRQGGDSEGVDLNLAYGFDAGLIGELELNVQLSHVLDLTPPLAPASALNPLPGRSGDPFTAATIGFNWTRGNFSGTVSSQYRDGLMLDGRMQSTGMTTVDINFAWRTPWNASLSVGAQNLLGQEDMLGNDFVAPPEVDNAFSRVPYVRYEQDL